ncbi:MAG: membrane dipeptidase, partial [Planctomycetota bacterium]
LHSKTYSRQTSIYPERSQKYGLGSTTAADMVKLLGMLSDKKLVSESASQQMFELMLACEDDTKIARFLPSGTKVANKTGEVSASRTDAALVESPSGPIAICVLTTDNDDQRWADDNAAHLLCAEVGRAVYEFFNPIDAITPRDGDKPLAIGAAGKLVQALQRTLNARSKPSPRLAVDGDFGPATQAAVKAFQTQNKLAANGIVGKETWDALGPLLGEDAVPAPEVVNSEPQPKADEDSLKGKPFVTCKAWAICDGRGVMLWDENGDTALDMASTTKIMTGYLVAKLATEDPEVLKEMVTFSERADKTSGSTSDVGTGEKLTVRELLYGLLLPSGNDASVAFAEHFGPRLMGQEESEKDPLDLFVDAMNREAESLGLEKTSFRNPHGLTAAGHKASAKDLLRLANAAMRIPVFAETVRTRRHGCTLQGQGGYRRNVVWRNTNRLLNTKGYVGVKTGTTGAAGACLVSRSQRNGQTLTMAVLGSASSAARYADSRNLYRWAWKKLAEEAAKNEIKVSKRAREIHDSSIVIDGHNDLPWTLRASGGFFEKLDINQPQPKFHTDIPRLKAGGVGAQFWSVWVPVSTRRDGSALQTTLEQIETVEKMVNFYPDVFELAKSTADIRRIRKSGKIASLIGVEGGHSIENSLNVLRKLYERGARYMTLTHSETLDWADSATDKQPHGGLTPFGEEVIREMNKLGMLVDLSHVSDECMKDALQVSTAPVIFSHSSAWELSQHPRNVKDDVLKLTAANGGVVMINFYTGYITQPGAKWGVARANRRDELKEKYGDDDQSIRRELRKFEATMPRLTSTVHDVLDHIDHIAKVAGIDHVGLGSDYDGVPSVPLGLDDVSKYPAITQGMLDRGYSDEDIRKVLGENLMRVMAQAEKVAGK